MIDVSILEEGADNEFDAHDKEGEQTGIKGNLANGFGFLLCIVELGIAKNNKFLNIIIVVERIVD